MIKNEVDVPAKPTFAEAWAKFEHDHDSVAETLLWVAKAWGFVLIWLGILGGFGGAVMAIIASFVPAEQGGITPLGLLLVPVLVTVALVSLKLHFALLETTDW